jgi:peptide/nickel transport system permease protein
VYLLRRHVGPGLGPVLVSRFLFWAPIAVFIQAGLAFLGLGDPLEVSWGSMLNKAVNYQGLYFTSLWTWWVLPAGFAIAVTVLGFTLVGIGLEPWFNPRSVHGSERSRTCRIRPALPARTASPQAVRRPRPM